MNLNDMEIRFLLKRQIEIQQKIILAVNETEKARQEASLAFTSRYLGQLQAKRAIELREQG